MSWKCAAGPRGKTLTSKTYPNRASSGRAAFPMLTNDRLLPLELKLCLPLPLAGAFLELHPAALKVVQVGMCVARVAGLPNGGYPLYQERKRKRKQEDQVTSRQRETGR